MCTYGHILNHMEGYPHPSRRDLEFWAKTGYLRQWYFSFSLSEFHDGNRRVTKISRQDRRDLLKMLVVIDSLSIKPGSMQLDE